MITDMILTRVWRAVRGVIVKRSAGWLAALVVLVAALLIRWQPEWEAEIVEGRDALTNQIWQNETVITGVVGQLPTNIK